MAQPRPWLDEIIDALKELGGKGTLNEIAQKIVDRDIMDFKANPNYRNKIRGTLYNHSSDSTHFKSEIRGEKDIFYSVAGIGKGHWGLRNFEADQRDIDLTEEYISFKEGAKQLKQHIVRERKPQVIKLAKERFKKKYGSLFCEICNFSFFKMYGDIGEDFIEGHHTTPISVLEEGEETKIEDIALVCSNCHQMLHRKQPWLTKDELKKIINPNYKR
ncbi:HNH endonuclease [Brevibacillus laterosporus]|uniref:HNH endonuclease n=1 Tax=Brevibacillus laterosporus TaxID=1465 RepID=A0AAP3DMA3_BRELA|nr:HNH endonuclease [Brevibacillus laterosporus]MCR8982759.1 HNH endonuclease [Brevibacillus laterosporus]MCZ0809915.1 HNH endonuclease [Brevibacillus laterosporus]MCZ0828473.1 HNH endonuclease [Brevibacillus laterosporus]MCZ0852540.1 HNH endonuclease [Brevibacillus laterosporus]